MDKQFMVVLWNDKYDEAQDIYPHKIEYLETLKEAVLFLVQNGARYDHQELVQKVDWMPGDNAPAKVAQTHVMTPEEQELANKPNPTTPIKDQPVVVNAQGQPTGGSYRPLSISERLPKNMMGAILADD